jgi:alcohol dehydrogenase
LEIKGSHGMQAHRYPAMLEMMRVGKLQPRKLLGKRIALDDARAALMRMGASSDPGISVITSF